MPFIIHVGTHKTGTTAIQRFASAHRSELRELGIWYPSYTEIGLFDHYAHHHLAFAIAQEPGKKLRPDDATRFIEYIDENRKPDEIILISAEPMYRLTMDLDQKTHRWKSSSAEYWDARDKFIGHLREAFPFDDVEILICLRRQESFARSVFQERVKVTKSSDPFATFLHKERALFDYLGQIEAYAKHFPKIDIVTFDSLVDTGDLHTAFFNHLGVDVSFTNHKPVTNVSLPIELVEFKRLLNATEMSRDEIDKIGKALSGLAGNKSLKLARDLDWLPHEQIAAFQGSFERDNERLRAQYAPSLPAPLFSPPEPTGKQRFRGLSPKRALQIAQHFMKPD